MSDVQKLILAGGDGNYSVIALGAPPSMLISNSESFVVTGGATAFSFSGKVWDEEQEDVTVSVTLAGVTKTITVTSVPDVEPIGANFTINFDAASEADDLDDGAYSNLVFTATNESGISTSVTWEYTVTIGTGAYVNIISKVYPVITWDVQNPAGNTLTKLEILIGGTVKRTWLSDLASQRSYSVAENDLVEGSNTIQLKIYYGASDMSLVEFTAEKDSLTQTPVNFIVARYRIHGQMTEAVAWMEHTARMVSDDGYVLSVVNAEPYNALVASLPSENDGTWTGGSWTAFETAIGECDLELTARDGQNRLDDEIQAIEDALDLLVEDT